MKRIDEKYINQLRNHGLRVSKPFGEGHTFEFGVKVGKPKSTKGNHIRNYSFGFGDTLVDAPVLNLFCSENEWIVLLQDGVPNDEPGDFLHRWQTLDQAVADILDYFFNSPERMLVKDLEWNKTQ
ncbi:MAG: hypothetical protein KIT34_03900 [Cyanobacteria bacterium TGS_CYA1]|nr:hypothetical protein [Cyanobacteria bacterium TGS_CYA1]